MYPKVTVVDHGDNAVLLKVEVSKLLRRQFLVGQDSANNAPPFVTQVFNRMATVAEAFDSLVPKAVRQAMEAGLDVKRQGDFFFIPCEAPSTPGTRCPRCGQGTAQYQWEGNLRERLGERFNPRALYYYLTPTRHEVSNLGWGRDQDWAVVHYQPNLQFVRGVVSAPDHERLRLDTWHKAIRRNSVAGVGDRTPGAD